MSQVSTFATFSAKAIRQAGRAANSARPGSRSGATHRTGAPVLRGSREAGTFEHDFFMTPAKGEPDRMHRIVKQAGTVAKELRRKLRAGERLSASERLIALVTDSVVNVHDALMTLTRLCGGKVYPSYEHLMEKTGYVRETVAKALKALEGIGALVKQRRFKRVDNDHGERRYVQTSNAYRPTLAEKVVAFLPRWMRPAPVPVDEIQREIDRQDHYEHMRSQLNCREFAKTIPFASSDLESALAEFGKGIDVRDASPSDGRNRD